MGPATPRRSSRLTGTRSSAPQPAASSSPQADRGIGSCSSSPPARRRLRARSHRDLGEATKDLADGPCGGSDASPPGGSREQARGRRDRRRMGERRQSRATDRRGSPVVESAARMPVWSDPKRTASQSSQSSPQRRRHPARRAIRFPIEFRSRMLGSCLPTLRPVPPR